MDAAPGRPLPPGDRLSHLRSHLSPDLAERLPDILLPLGRTDLAERWFVTEEAATNMQRRMAELIWPYDGPGYGMVRLALVRIAAGLDPCPCEQIE